MDTTYTEYTKIKNCTILKQFAEIQDEIYNMEVFDDDIWLCSFPRSGTTWTSEAIWLLTHDLNFEKGIKETFFDKFPYLEASAIRPWSTISLLKPDVMGVYKNSVEYCAKGQKGRRLFKTHLPWELLPKQIQEHERKPKIVHVTRNPKDVALSYYHLVTGRIHNSTLSLEEFSDQFFRDDVLYCPYFRYNWNFEQQSDNCNILSLKYEEMKADLRSQLERLSTFLGTGPIADDDMTKLLNYLSFDAMKSNPSTNQKFITDYLKGNRTYKNEYSFIRRGVAEAYKDEFSAELNAKYDKWIEDNARMKNLLPKVGSYCKCLQM